MKGVVRLKMGTWTYVPNCLAEKRKTLGVVSIVMTDRH